VSLPEGITDQETTAGGEPLSRKDYERDLKRLHVELVKLQEWVKRKGLKVCIVFEGRDGAGKGGTIKAITERVSPRVFRVVALPAPSERERSQMYAQRYLAHLPAAGEVVIFDRSWYNRAGVERVMGFCTEEEARGFLKVVPSFENLMVNSGIILLKYWLEVSPEEQQRRLESRIEDGRKTWKLTPMDIKSFDRWDDYTRARDEMIAASDTEWAPWFVARSSAPPEPGACWNRACAFRRRVALIAFIGWLASAGSIVSFISESVMVGFKCGVALFLAWRGALRKVRRLTLSLSSGFAVARWMWLSWRTPRRMQRGWPFLLPGPYRGLRRCLGHHLGGAALFR
jgi:polyphosphate kinase 2